MSDIAAEARQWIGTPFVPQQSVKGSGCDCKGFLSGVARELGLPEAEHVNALAVDYSLARVPSQRLKVGLAEAGLVQVDEAAAGHVLLLRIGGAPSHLAIVTEPGLTEGRAVHASVESGVRETRLRALLKMMPLDSIWRFGSCQ